MELWQERSRNSILCPDLVAQRFGLDGAVLAKVAERYPMRITPHQLELIRDADDPLGRQVIPDVQELLDPSELSDPLDEERLSPVPNLVHRYPYRVLLLVAGSCFSYCRFCTRKRKVGCPSMSVSLGDILKGIDYIAEHPEVNEVILSGGDPLTMSDRLLDDVLARLSRIPHLQVVRIGSRAPVVMPERITESLCMMLQRYQPLYFLTHFNHPREITEETVEACQRLVRSGVIVANQTVLLRGVNDQADTLFKLFHTLYRLQVRPYYLHQMDLTCGTGHFRTRLEEGIALMEQLRGPLSGLAMPNYIVDLPGGHGKIPLTPDYVQSLGRNARLKAADGTLIDYPQI